MTITDLNAEVRSLCDATTTSYTAADLLRRVNSALETLVAQIINSDGTWEWDDTNYTTTPIGKGDLVSGQISYSFADEFLQIESVDVLDTGGIYRRLTPFDASEVGQSFEEYFGITFSGTAYTAPTAFPQFYDKNDDTIRLSSGPSATVCTLTNGIRVKFKRTASLFTSAEVSTGTKAPGIASPYHQLIAYMAAVPYCISYKKDRIPLFEKKIDEMTKDMLRFYGTREKDVRQVMTMNPISSL